MYKRQHHYDDLNVTHFTWDLLPNDKITLNLWAGAGNPTVPVELTLVEYPPDVDFPLTVVMSYSPENKERKFNNPFQDLKNDQINRKKHQTKIKRYTKN